MRRPGKWSRLTILGVCCLLACEPGPQRGPDGLTEAEGRLVAGWMSVALVARARSTRLSDYERLDVLNEIGEALGEAAAPIFEQLMNSPVQEGPGGQTGLLADVCALFTAYAPVAFAHFRRTVLQRPEAGPLQRAVIDRHPIIRGGAFSGDGIEDLPRHVEAPDGQLTLFADFAASAEALVPLYLVNRTSAPVRFITAEGELLLRLESLTDQGWRPAWPHQESMCGNSYLPMTLQPQTWTRYEARYPHVDASHPATVRFVVRGTEPTVGSKAGPGFVVPAGVALAEEPQDDAD